MRRQSEASSASAIQPAIKVVGFHVEGVPQSPAQEPHLLQDLGGNAVSPSPNPVIIPPSFQVLHPERWSEVGLSSDTVLRSLDLELLPFFLQALRHELLFCVLQSSGSPLQRQQTMPARVTQDSDEVCSKALKDTCILLQNLGCANIRRVRKIHDRNTQDRLRHGNPSMALLSPLAVVQPMMQQSAALSPSVQPHTRMHCHLASTVDVCKVKCCCRNRRLPLPSHQPQLPGACLAVLCIA